MKNPIWPMNIDPLPLAEYPSGEVVEFRQMSYGRVKAIIYDENGIIIDEIMGHNFIEAYDTVTIEYPEAYWDPYEGEEE